MNKKNIIYYFIILIIIYKIFIKTENFDKHKIRDVVINNLDFNAEAIRNLDRISKDLLNNNKLTIYGGIDVKERFNYLPKGIIVAWNSNIIPEGWIICDGKNGTPNLLNRFILGNSSKHKLNSVGGETTVKLNQNNLPSHSHSVSISSVGNHSHKIIDKNKKAFNSSTYKRNNFCTTKYFACFLGEWKHWCSCYDKSPAHRWTGVNFTTISNLSLSDSGSHNHKITTGNTGGSASHNNMPPYYVLIWIMKL